MHFRNSVKPQSQDEGGQKSSIAIFCRNTIFYMIFCLPFDMRQQQQQQQQQLFNNIIICMM